MDGEAITRATQWCLRFLNGELKGRTVFLNAGINIVGSDIDAQVLLPNADVLPRHLLLNVGEVTVTAQKIGTGATRLNGEEIATQRKHIVAGDVLSVGKLSFQLDQSLHAVEGEDTLFAKAPEVSTLSPVPAQTSAHQVIEKRGFWAGIAAAVFALFGMAGLLVQHSMSTAQLKASVALAEIEKALTGFPELEVVAVAGGTIGVKGYVESNLRKQALQQALEPFGQHVSVRVHTAEDMVEQARRYVNDPGVAVSYAGKGQIIFSGAADDKSVSQRIRNLREDLHPTVLVVDKVQYQPKGAKKAPEMNVEWSAWQSILPARMVSITEDENGLRHIQLANGTRYYEGSILKSGAEIKRIETDGLIVEGGNFDSLQTKQ